MKARHHGSFEEAIGPGLVAFIIAVALIPTSPRHPFSSHHIASHPTSTHSSNTAYPHMSGLPSFGPASVRVCRRASTHSMSGSLHAGKFTCFVSLLRPPPPGGVNDTAKLTHLSAYLTPDIAGMQGGLALDLFQIAREPLVGCIDLPLPIHQDLGPPFFYITFHGTSNVRHGCGSGVGGVHRFSMDGRYTGSVVDQEQGKVLHPTQPNLPFHPPRPKLELGRAFLIPQ